MVACGHHGANQSKGQRDSLQILEGSDFQVVIPQLAAIVTGTERAKGLEAKVN